MDLMGGCFVSLWTNTANTPVEIFETLTNLKVLKKSIRLGSGGGGTFKGGAATCSTKH